VANYAALQSARRQPRRSDTGDGGAGLPIIDICQKLAETGDRVLRIDGSSAAR
jgi:hypothetical protein